MSPLLITLVVAVAIHALWIIGLRWLNVLFLVCATFIVINPFGLVMGKQQADIVLLRYAHVYPMLVMGVVGAMWANVRLFRGATLAMLLFYGLLIGGALYSEYPTIGLKWKILGLCTFVGAMGMAHSIHDVRDLRRNVRVFLPSMAILLIVLADYVMRDHGTGRLGAYDMNPNYIGLLLASCISIAIYLACWDRSTVVRVVSGVLALSMFILIIYTGSRTAAGAAILCTLICYAPLTRRPGRLVVTTAVLFAVAYVTIPYLTFGKSSERLTVIAMDSGRDIVWQRALEQANDSIVFGVGTMYQQPLGSQLLWSNLHSVYVQIFCELGFVGVFVFLVVLAHLAVRSLGVLRGVSLPEKWLAFSCVAVALSTGLFESSPLFGNALPSICWGFGLGLIDRLPRWQAEEDAGLGLGEVERVAVDGLSYLPTV